MVKEKGYRHQKEMKGNPRPLRIAILLDKFLPSRGGERYFSFLADELAKRGHEVHIFATAVEEKAKTTSACHVHLIPVWSFPRSLRILSFLWKARRVIEKERFDIVHGVAPALPVNVYNPHGGVEQAYLRQEFSSISGRLYYAYRFLRRYLTPRHYLEVWAQRRLYRGGNVKRTIAISRMIKRDIISYYGVPDKEVAVVFNSVDLERFRPDNRGIYREKKRADLGVAPSEILLLFAGNNFRLKGLEPLIRALAVLKQRLPDRSFCLVVAGRGRQARYSRLSDRLGVSDRIIFLGPVTGMEQYYAACDIYVHPTFYDSCSLTVLEALASGLPVITSRFNGASDVIVSEEGGRVIEDPRDTSALADAIAAFSEEKIRSSAATVARGWMERYGPARNVEETLAVYYEVVDNPPLQPFPSEGGERVGVTSG